MGLYMFLRETSKEFHEAKRCEQRLIASAFSDVVARHCEEDGPVSRAIRSLPKTPTAAQIASIVRHLRVSLRTQSTPFLRDLALSIFVGAPLFESLKMAVELLPQPASTGDLFGVTRVAAGKYVVRSGNIVKYCIEHPRMIWSAFMGSRLGTMIFGWISPFDPKAFARNASGQLFKERFHDRHGASLEIDWTVGPTPTVGDQLAPEALAAIAALQSAKSLCYPHSMWIYVNIQNMRSLSERRRSEALIEASRKNPAVFRVASLSVDAPFYKDRDETLQTLRAHKKNLLVELRKGLGPSSFSWYAFSLIEEERDEWWHCMEQVVEKASFLAEMTDRQILVFHELVVLGLVRAWQGFCCAKAVGRVMSTVACKECIDRGGSVNAAFIWSLSQKEEPERSSDVMAVLWGRPLLARSRLIEQSRTRGFEAIVRSFLPSSVRQYLEEVWNGACHGRWAKDGP